MNDIPENSNNNITTSDSDVDYLRGVKSSTCLLLPTTPSPTPMDFKHPLSEEVSDGNFLTMDTEPMQNLDASAGDSSSSGDSNSVVQDPVSAQLINNISMLDYQTLSKNGDLIMGQTEECKLKGDLNMSNRKLPSFVNWNWGVIRKILLWIVVSALVACLGAIIAMVFSIPKVCNPDVPWYQGKVFYEVFPTGFKDPHSNHGDLKGLLKNIDYIKDLGVSVVHLNYIFEAKQYPEHYDDIISLKNIDKQLGDVKDFHDLVEAIHDRDMQIIIDIPIMSMGSPIKSPDLNSSHVVLLSNNTSITFSDPTTEAIAYWSSDEQNIDGFYLRHLEDYVDNVNFGKTLQIWKQIVGSRKIFIASYDAYEKAKGASLNVLLSRVELIDVYLDLNKGTNGVKQQIDKILNSSLWSMPHYPWIHWNIGNMYSERVTEKHMNNTLALTVLEFVLPGTVSIFYGDEIGSAVKDDVNNIDNFFVMDMSEYNESYSLTSNYSSDMNKSLLFLKDLIKMRLNTPTIYLNGIYKEGNKLKNAGIRNTEENLVVIERWYPRRNTCVFVSNLGNTPISTDLSSMFYGGTVVASTNSSLVGQMLYFDQITIAPNSAFILKLEK